MLHAGLRERMRMALLECSVAMSWSAFGFGFSNSVTASTYLSAGEIVSRANVFCARKICTAKTTMNFLAHP